MVTDFKEWKEWKLKKEKELGEEELTKEMFHSKAILNDIEKVYNEFKYIDTPTIQRLLFTGNYFGEGVDILKKIINHAEMVLYESTGEWYLPK